MARFKGCSGNIQVGANPIGELRGWDYTEEREVEDVSVAGACVSSFDVGPRRVSGSFESWWDMIDDAGQSALIAAFDAGTTVAILIRPGGTGSTLPEVGGDALITQVGGQMRVDGVVGGSFRFFIDGAFTRANQT